MHDELIERRLRSALHDEAEALPFTITSAELERRLALRRRSFAGRRLTLLLAAGIGIGLFGVGGALSGLFDQRIPTPTPGPSSPVAVVESESPLPTAPVELPTLDELIAADPGGVVVANAHGPTDSWGLPVEGQPRSSVDLGVLNGGGPSTYVLTAACLDGTALKFDVRVPLSRGPADGPTIPCDGRLHDAQFEASAEELSFTADGGASWRLVVRGPSQQPTGSVDPAEMLTADEGQDEITRFSDVVSAEAEPWGDSGLVMQNVGSLFTRESYTIQMRCASGDTFRIAFGNDDEERGRLIGNETQLACDGGVHVIRQTILEPYGGQAYVVGKPGSALDLLITGNHPPIELLKSIPGWTLQSGLGPNFSFDGTGSGFTAPGIEGGGTLLFAMTCTGTEPIEMTIEVGPKVGDRQETFIAQCAPGGQTTSQTFQVASDYVDVFFEDAAPLTWTALSILVRDVDR
jgi:hypothetical protein